MSDASVTPEPSMDEILQKIQRIIAEDEQPADQPAAAPPRSAEILNLTEAVADNGTVRYLNPVEPEPPPPAPRPPERRIEPVPKRPEAANRGSGERLLSDSTAGQAAAAFAQLAAIQRERRRATEFAMGGAERTLEDVIREMLRPMLQGWLDEKLPEILERLVRAELSRALGDIAPS